MEIPDNQLPDAIYNTLILKRGEREKEDASPSQIVASATKHDIGFEKGNHDNALFHLANHLVKGGMPALSISKYLTFFAQH